MTTNHSLIDRSDTQWYKDAVIYELHVRAFFDSDGDGRGDFVGMCEKLDYLQDLGVTAIWVLPFYPSPFRDDGYDIADYRSIHPSYGNLDDFKRFLDEAHQRGLRVITELVLNHTSDLHPWFQQARRAAPGSPERDFYVWSDTPEKYKGVRIIFKDFEHSNWAYDPIAKAYYFHRFYSHQPDLNFDNPAVHEALFEVMDYWMDMGVDGMRLDAVPYLFEREGTSCENLPETHDWLKKLRAHVEKRYPDRMLLAEANQWPEDAVAYYGDGDECHMNFHFPLMPRLFMALKMENRFPIIDILDQTPEIHESCQWAIFLRNHDELTLEMVTDEERDFMYRSYAQDPQMRINLGIRRRLAPLLGNDRRRIEMINALLFSLPGTPVIYYGDEIGMGDNFYHGDRNGVRTPMQWSPDRNAGFSRCNPQKLYLPVIIDPEYNYETINVEAQQGNQNSLLWFMKRILSVRRTTKAFSWGSMEFLEPDNYKILAYLREHEGETVLVVVNLSRSVQHVHLDLSRFGGHIPVEMFSHTTFPEITERPYFLTLNQHSFFWLKLEPQQAGSDGLAAGAPVELAAERAWQEVLQGPARDRLLTALSAFLRSRRWFRQKTHEIADVSLMDRIALQGKEAAYELAILEVTYGEIESEVYCLPLAHITGEEFYDFREEHPRAVVASLSLNGAEGALVDATHLPVYQQALLKTMSDGAKLKGSYGSIVPTGETGFLTSETEALTPKLLQGEQSNSSIFFGHEYSLKCFRKLEWGENPDLEILTFFREHTDFRDAPKVHGSLEYRRNRHETANLCMLQAYVPNLGDAWTFTLDHLRRFMDGSASKIHGKIAETIGQEHFIWKAATEAPQELLDGVSLYTGYAELLGQRTGEMHLALASRDDLPDFEPQESTLFSLRALYQAFRNLATDAVSSLRKASGAMSENIRSLAEEIASQEQEMLSRLQTVSSMKGDVVVTRCHGDFHLGQVLYTGKDFVIIDYEGEPARTLGERKQKRSPLKDVAGMIRSFHYAAYTVAQERAELLGDTPLHGNEYAQLAEWWYAQVSRAYLESYRATVGQAGFMPGEEQTFRQLVEIFLLEKALYELRYELNNRPDWVTTPLLGIRGLLGTTL